jgi:hypothetical protein
MEIENTTYQEIDFAPKIGINWSPTDESGVVIFTMQKAVVVGGELKHLLPPANDSAVGSKCINGSDSVMALLPKPEEFGWN